MPVSWSHTLFACRHVFCTQWQNIVAPRIHHYVCATSYQMSCEMTAAWAAAMFMQHACHLCDCFRSYTNRFIVSFVFVGCTCTVFEFGLREINDVLKLTYHMLVMTIQHDCICRIILRGVYRHVLGSACML